MTNFPLFFASFVTFNFQLNVVMPVIFVFFVFALLWGCGWLNIYEQKFIDCKCKKLILFEIKIEAFFYCDYVTHQHRCSFLFFFERKKIIQNWAGHGVDGWRWPVAIIWNKIRPRILRGLYYRLYVGHVSLLFRQGDLVCMSFTLKIIF